MDRLVGRRLARMRGRSPALTPILRHRLTITLPPPGSVCGNQQLGSSDLLMIRAELPLVVGMVGQKLASFGPSRRSPGHFPGCFPYLGPSIIKRSGEPPTHDEVCLVQGPFVAGARPPAAQRVRIGLAELAAPLTHRLVGEDHAALGQQLLHVAVAQGEPAVPPHRVGDDRRQEPVACLGGRCAHFFHALRIACGAVSRRPQLS